MPLNHPMFRHLATISRRYFQRRYAIARMSPLEFELAVQIDEMRIRELLGE